VSNANRADDRGCDVPPRGRRGDPGCWKCGRNTVVIGIVGYARGDVVTVAGKTYDLGGARFQDGRGAPLAHPSDLRGTSIEILSRNGRIETVTLYRTLPQ